MSGRRKRNTHRKGSLAYENWRIINNRQAASGIYEVPLFTDAPLEKFFSKEYGPYYFMHSGHPLGQEGECIPALVLRVEEGSGGGIPGSPDVWEEMLHETWDDTVYPEQPSDMDRYHGGFLHDEVAALASLCLGIRLKAGGVSRFFLKVSNFDPLGRPIARDAFRTPTFLRVFAPAFILPQAIVPTTFAPHLLANLLDLKPEATTALTKTARLYQEALWVVESAPEQTWLWLVSAVETAANYWRPKRESKELLRSLGQEELRISGNQRLQKLVALLEDIENEEVFNKIADIMAPLLLATRKFTAFMTQFGFSQDAPFEPRPPVEGQFEWTLENFQRAMRKIYSHRSDALHAGQAFPYPMCRPAEHPKGWDAPAEKPRRKVEHPTATWEVKDMPFHLHMFASIVQRALCAWWEQKCPIEVPSAG
jgi:hypothetical protein